MAGETLPIDPVSASAGGAGLQAFVLGMIIILFIVAIIVIALYVYTALALMTIARKTKTTPAWLAWIPIGNMVLLSRIAKMHWWPVLMIIPAFIFLALGTFVSSLMTLFIILYFAAILVMLVYMTMWYWKLFEAVSRPGVWAIIIMVASFIGGVFNYIPGMGFKIAGAAITIVGSVLFMVFLGIAAWSKDSVAKVARKSGR